MLSGWMVDRVATTTSSAAFKAAQLSDQAGVIQQFDSTRIQNGQQVLIQIALWRGVLLITDSKF